MAPVARRVHILKLFSSCSCLLLLTAARGGAHLQPPPVVPGRGTPCVQLDGAADVVVLSFEYPDAAVGLPVRTFAVTREFVDRQRIDVRADRTTKEYEMSAEDVEKCLDKRHCSHHDHIAPGGWYVYYIQAVDEAGQRSEPTQISCATAAPAAQSCPRPPDEGDEDGGHEDGIPRRDCPPQSERMPIAAALALVFVAAVVSVLLTSLFWYRFRSSERDIKLVKQNTRTLKEKHQQAPSLLGHTFLDTVVYRLAKLLPMIYLAAFYGLWYRIWLPLEREVLPRLKGMEARAFAFTGALNTTATTLAELQHEAQFKIVDTDKEAFDKSEGAWITGITQLHWSMRYESPILLLPFHM